MTQKRKAELQRKLSMAPLPKPPSDLGDRIKAGIPQDLLSTQRERERFSRSLAFNLRVAASVILLVTSVFFAIRLLSPEDVPAPLAIRARQTAAPQVAADTAEVTVTLAEVAKDEKVRPSVEGRRRAGRAAESAALHGDQREKKAEAVVGGLVPESRVDTPAQVAAAPVPPPAEQAMAPAVANEAVYAEPAAKRSAIALSKSRDLAADSPRSVFGLSLDAAEFQRLRTLVDRGQAPAAESVNLEALVSHFAGPARATRRPVELEAEASRPPLPADDGSAILRYTIDTADSAGRPIVATSARLEIDLNEEAIAEHRIVTGASLTATEPMLMRNVSATGLIELRLRPGVRRGTTIATVRLRYRAAADSREQVLVRTFKARDLSRSWESASYRHRLATLGALWGQSLQGTNAADEIASAAAKLATEAPEDPRARELAAAATVSSRLRSSGPTGSGR